MGRAVAKSINAAATNTMGFAALDPSYRQITIGDEAIPASSRGEVKASAFAEVSTDKFASSQ